MERSTRFASVIFRVCFFLESVLGSPLQCATCLPRGSAPLAQQCSLHRCDCEVSCSLATEMSDTKEVAFASCGH